MVCDADPEREDGADGGGDKLGGGDDLVREAEALDAVAAAVLPRVMGVHGAAQQLSEEERAHGDDALLDEDAQPLTVGWMTRAQTTMNMKPKLYIFA